MDINLDIDFNINEDFFENSFNNIELNSRYIKPPKHKYLKNELLYFDNAEKLAKSINLQGNDNIFVLLSGNFIFGDFLEALFYSKNIYTKKLQISTLSLSYENILSLKNLLIGNFVEKLDLIVSDYFFSHERNKLIKDLYENLDFDNKFQLSVAGIHTKIASFETELGKKYVIHGSANLRSSNNIEQISIEDNSELFDFVSEFNNKIIKNQKTINKKNIKRGKQLWHQVTAETQREEH